MAAASPKKALIGIGVGAVVLAAVIGVVMHLGSESKSEVSGALTIDGEGFSPLHCRSGRLGEHAPRDQLRFQGVDLIGPSQNARSLRVLDDPAEGTSVLVIDPGEPPRPIDRAACDTFEVELGDTGEMIMDVWGMEGSIELDCPDVSGQVSFAQCYGGR